MNKMNKFLIGGMLCIFSCMVFFGCGSKEKVLFTTDTQIETKSDKVQIDQADNVKEETVYPFCVYICGAVVSPGVYEVSDGARICDVIDKSGGFTDEASTDYLNQAEFVTDGQMIYVPTKEEAFARSEGYLQGESSTDKPNGGKIDINTASKDELTSISGIGEGRAESIIKYRSENGRFNSIEDIMNVSGIGNSIFENIKDYITVN